MNKMMKSLVVKNNIDAPIIETREVPDHHNNVLIRVKEVGICKTDVWVARHIQNHEKNIILGHEMSGYVEHPGNSDDLKKGDLVTVNPFPAGGDMMGVTKDGCISEFVSVPAHQVYSCQSIKDTRIAAYIEPVAASLSPLSALKGCLDQPIGLIGNGRIALLTIKMLELSGIKNITILPGESNRTFPVVIDCLGTKESIEMATRHLADHGSYIIKSRNPEKVAVNFYDLVKKNITIYCKYYHDFAESVEFAEQHQNHLHELIGQSYSLNDWEIAFNDSEHADKKLFIDMEL